MASALLQANSLPAQWRELAILRVGHVYSAAYEVHHHENIARWVGLADAAIAAAATRSTDDLPDEDAAILSWTDRLLVNHTLNVGFYQLVCNFLNTFNVTTDDEGHLS